MFGLAPIDLAVSVDVIALLAHCLHIPYFVDALSHRPQLTESMCSRTCDTPTRRRNSLQF